jgi:transcriptional regulator GlxA family with amidase domain
LARELDVSHNHLTRSFRAATGLAPVEFIRERRVNRAEELLRHTTLPIKAIAAQVGLGDFHSFNKVMRRAKGASPRRLRI